MLRCAWSLRLNEPLLVTEFVLWECVNTFSKPRDHASAHALIDHVNSEPTYEVAAASHGLFAAALQLHRDRPDKEWSLTDCAAFYLMGQRGLTRALAYDRHSEQAGFEARLRHDPPA